MTVCTANETISDSMGSAFLSEGGCGAVVLDVEGIDITFDVPGAPVDQGVSTSFGVNLSTPHDVYGIELHITDTPSSISATNVSQGDLVAGLNGTVSFLSLIHI